MSVAARTTSADVERGAHVWVWMAHLCRVEADALLGSYAWPPREPTAQQRELAEAHLDGAPRLDERAAQVAGCTTDDEAIAMRERAFARFVDASPYEVAL